MKILIALLVILALAATAVCLVCTIGVAQIGKREQQEADWQMEDDRCTAAYYDDHDVSGLIEED